ncbi:MAG: metalloregulator ArsR/SmtB family transcription factor [Candidatus Omnitrophica bacterium]|nr:metalloregulator ArsR/SmtB family transcription factor [Candidatus Omnitrophota bacterium]
MAMKQIKNLHQFLHAISDEKRIRILKMLEKTPMCVCQMRAILEIKQPTVSKHIKALKKAGIVMTRKLGQFRVYSLNYDHPYICIWWIISTCMNRNEVEKDRIKVKRVIKKVQPQIYSRMAIH